MASLELHSLAKQIRASADSVEQYDLGGYNQQQATSLVTDAFSTPIESEEPIKVTFVIGAGKLSRQRYDENLAKYLSSALRELGYEEDRGASACEACMGSFKSQHDTSKNLKFMHVFPKVTLGAGAAAAAAGEEGATEAAVHSIELLCASCELPTFKEMVSHKTPSWGQRKRLAKALHDMAERFAAAEAKMIQMQPLTPQEQVLYDASSAELLAQKTQWLTASIKQLVDDGALTAAEKAEVLANLDSKIAALQTELAAVAPAEGAPALTGAAAAKAERLEKQRTALTARRATVAAVKPASHPLKRSSVMKELFVKIAAAEKLEAVKGRLLTMPEVKLVGEKPEMEAQLEEAIAESRGWFEDEEVFQSRVEDVKKAAEKAGAKKTTSSSSNKPLASSTRAMDGWETVGAEKSSSRKQRR